MPEKQKKTVGYKLIVIIVVFMVLTYSLLLQKNLKFLLKLLRLKYLQLTVKLLKYWSYMHVGSVK